MPPPAIDKPTSANTAPTQVAPGSFPLPMTGYAATMESRRTAGPGAPQLRCGASLPNRSHSRFFPRVETAPLSCPSGFSSHVGFDFAAAVVFTGLQLLNRWPPPRPLRSGGHPDRRGSRSSGWRGSGVTRSSRTPGVVTAASPSWRTALDRLGKPIGRVRDIVSPPPAC